MIRANVSHDVPVYSPQLSSGTYFSLPTEGEFGLSRPGCLVLLRGGLPVQRQLPTQALTAPSVE